MSFLLASFLVVTLFLVGCGQATQNSVPAASGGLTQAEVEGTYTQVGDDSLILEFKGGTYKKGSKEVFATGSYHTHSITNGGLEVHIDLAGKLQGTTATLYVHKEGDVLVVKDGDSGVVTRFQKAK